MIPSEHINDIAQRLTPALKRKYAAGVRAHGGKLWTKNVGPEIQDELLGLIVYVYTHEEQVKRLVAAAEIMISSQHYGHDGVCNHYADLRAALAPFLNNEKN